MKYEILKILTESSDDKVDAVLPKSGNEVHVARKPIQPRDDHWTFHGSGLIQCCPKTGAAQKGVSPGSRINILEPTPNRKGFFASKRLDFSSLSIKPNTTAPLLR
jgi:hypothetical protein